MCPMSPMAQEGQNISKRGQKCSKWLVMKNGSKIAQKGPKWPEKQIGQCGNMKYEMNMKYVELVNLQLKPVFGCLESVCDRQ